MDHKAKEFSTQTPTRTPLRGMAQRRLSSPSSNARSRSAAKSSQGGLLFSPPFKPQPSQVKVVVAADDLPHSPLHVVAPGMHSPSPLLYPLSMPGSPTFTAPVMHEAISPFRTIESDDHRRHLYSDNSSDIDPDDCGVVNASLLTAAKTVAESQEGSTTSPALSVASLDTEGVADILCSIPSKPQAEPRRSPLSKDAQPRQGVKSQRGLADTENTPKTKDEKEAWSSLVVWSAPASPNH